MNAWGLVAGEPVDLSGASDGRLFALIAPMLAVLVSSGVAGGCEFDSASTYSGHDVNDVAIAVIEELERRGYVFTMPRGGSEAS